MKEFSFHPSEPYVMVDILFGGKQGHMVADCLQ